MGQLLEWAGYALAVGATTWVLVTLIGFTVLAWTDDANEEPEA